MRNFLITNEDLSLIVENTSKQFSQFDIYVTSEINPLDPVLMDV